MTVIEDIDWTSWTAQDLATLLFVVREGRILLIHKKRGLGKGKINGPGGRLEPGEKPYDCAIREVQEELVTTPSGLEACGSLRFQFTDGYALHAFVYLAADCDREPQETEEAVPLWFELDQIPYERMWEDDKLWIPLMLEGKYIEGRFLFDGDKMLGHVIEEVAGPDF